MKNIEKLLKATCPNHAYHVRHKLKEGSMMKNYMTIGALAKGKKLKDGAARNAAAPSPGRRLSCQSTMSLSPTSPSVSSNLLARHNAISLATPEYLC
jgi:hypothetical protein